MYKDIAFQQFDAELLRRRPVGCRIAAIIVDLAISEYGICKCWGTNHLQGNREPVCTTSNPRASAEPISTKRAGAFSSAITSRVAKPAAAAIALPLSVPLI